MEEAVHSPTTSAVDLLRRHEVIVVELLLESIRQNFFEFIKTNIIDHDIFYTGVKRSIKSLLQELKAIYLKDNRIVKHRLLQLTKHRHKSLTDISYEELILDFPIGYALFELHLSFHSNLKLISKLGIQQKDEFAKGLCLGAHMTTFFIFVIFRYEVFQDLTFLRMIKEFSHKNVYLSYPPLMLELVLNRTERFNHHNIFGN